MQCPRCGGDMEAGYLAAGQWILNLFTRIEWYEREPRFMAYAGDPLCRQGSPASIEAVRCRSCRLVTFTYDTERWR